MNAFSRKSLSTQVYEVLSQKILNRSWKPGFGIPNEIDLAKTYGVSVGTMRKALSVLEGEGLVHRRQGRGTFVSDPSCSELRNKFDRLFSDKGGRPEVDVRQIACVERLATPEESERLALPAAEHVLMCSQEVRLDRSVALFREAHIPRSLFPEFDASGTWDILAASRTQGLRLGSGTEKLSLKRPAPHVAKALGIDTSAMVLQFDRLVFAVDGQPVEWLVSWSELAGLHYTVTLT
jgi:GntR family transcriptional regulator